MKKILLLLFVVFLLFGCKSKEEKAAELIKNDMFKVLYDYDSYQAIETKVDSAFTTIYNDPIALGCAHSLNEKMKEAKKHIKLANDAIETMANWAGSRSSYGKEKYDNAEREVDEHLFKGQFATDACKVIVNELQERSKKISPKFCGWQVTHKFRCKNKGGDFDLGNYSYIIDKDFKTITHKEDLDDEKNIEIRSIIKEYSIE